MDSHDQSLGRFIRTRKLKGGAVAAFMSVPKHLRPSGWPPTLQLPEQGKKKFGSLDDPKFIEKIRRDAVRLNDRLDHRRALESRATVQGRRTVSELADIFYKTMRFCRLSEGRQKRARWLLNKIIDWSNARGSPLFADLVKADVEDFLSLYDGKPSAQTEARWIWNLISLEAMENRWRPDNPCKRIPWPRVTPKPVSTWDKETVERYARVAENMLQPGLAAMIRFGFHAGQRLGDLRCARWSKNFNGERFTMQQSKTRKTVTFLVTKQVTAFVERARDPRSDFLFVDADHGTGFTASGLYERFTEVRIAAAREGEDRLHLRALRHSAVCAMVRANVPLLNISRVTGHSLDTVRTLSERYAVDHQGFADDAMRIRNRAEGGSDDDFSNILPILNGDWLADEAKREKVTRPALNVDRPGRYVGALLGQHRHKWQEPAEMIGLWPDEDDDAASAHKTLEPQD